MLFLQINFPIKIGIDFSYNWSKLELTVLNFKIILKETAKQTMCVELPR